MRSFRAIATKIACHVPPLLSAQCKIDRDDRIDFDRISIQQGRLVAPLAHRIHCSGSEFRRSADDIDLLHVSVDVDNNMELHHTLEMLAKSFSRRSGIDLMY